MGIPVDGAQKAGWMLTVSKAGGDTGWWDLFAITLKPYPFSDPWGGSHLGFLGPAHQWH